MTILPILIIGDPVLHSPAKVVTDFDESLHELLTDLFETMEAAPGVGLAATQVGVGKQVFVFDWNDGEHHWRGVAVNPTLELSDPTSEPPDESDEVEGCLSIPGERAPLSRFGRAVLRAQDEKGEHFEIVAEGWLARIFQHEYDHLQGILYRDRLLPDYQAEIDEVVSELGWGKPGLTWLPGVDDLEG
jgi:peptide deformylase